MTFLSGNKQHQQRARAALPILVRQAWARQAIAYGDLGEEMGIHHRAFRYPLGTIAEALAELGASWGEQIPPIQGLVVNQSTRLPGEGFGWAVPNLTDYAAMPDWKKELVVERAHNDVFAYEKWLDVLAAFGLKPTGPAVENQPLDGSPKRGGAGESEAHRLLKEYVASHPSAIGLRASAGVGSIEFRLPSADAIDVIFQTPDEWVAVEVKADNADEAEICRGLFQCVKYRALVKAVLATEGRQLASRSLLVLGRAFPEKLVSLRNTLGITVLDQITWV